MIKPPPVWGKAHGKDSGNVQVCWLVNNALCNDSAALVDDWEEDELDDVLCALHGWALLVVLQQTGSLYIPHERLCFSSFECVRLITVLAGFAISCIALICASEISKAKKTGHKWSSSSQQDQHIKLASPMFSRGGTVISESQMQQHMHGEGMG